MTTQSSNNPFAPTYAAIDIGTNTLRLLIGHIDNGKLFRLQTSRSVTRLGQGLNTQGILIQDNIDNSISSLKQFKALIDKFKVQKIVAVGTSALRDAGNREAFVEAVKVQTGIDVIIISGDMEAELTVKGVLGYDPAPEFPTFITDIGGGSTEWILSDKDVSDSLVSTCCTIKGSIQIGAVRLYERFIRSDPPAKSEIDHIKNKVFESVSRSFRTEGISFRIHNNDIRSFVATGGTATTVAAIDMGLNTYDAEKVHLYRMSFASLKRLLEHLSSMPLCDRTNVKGLEPGRADIIIPGILILITVMEILKADTLTISDYGLLEGLLLSSLPVL